MSALHITLTNAGYAALVNAQNTGTNAVLVNRIGVTEQAFNSSDAAAAAMTALPGELKQLSTFAGDAVADDTIHVTIRDDGSDSYTLRGFGLYLADGTLLALYGQTDPILEKSTQAMLLLAADIRFTGVDTAVLEFGDTNWINPPATDQTPGVVQLATPAQAVAGTDPTRALTPATHKAAIDARFGTGSPSTFIKGLLNLATAALFRSALGIKGAALKDDGAGNGLNADLLDGQHGAYYRDYRNLTQVPSSFPPSPHGHNWIDIDFKPATATRWPTFAEVSDKPTSFPPSAHTHSAGDIRMGTFDPDRIPTLQTSKVSGLDQALAAKANSAGLTSASGYFSVHSYSEAVYGVGLMRSFYDANNARWNLAAISTPGNSVPLTVTINGHEVYHKGNIVGVDFSHTTTYAYIRGDGGTHGITLARSGSQAIFTASSLVRLEANGGRLDVNSNGVSVTGTITPSGGYDFGSSRKLKDVDGPMPYGLAEVRRIVTLIGRYKAAYNDDGRTRLFFDAEQFMEVMPEAVEAEGVEFDGELVPAIKIDQLLPPAYRAIAELADIVDGLRAELAAYRAGR